LLSAKGASSDLVRIFPFTTHSVVSSAMHFFTWLAMASLVDGLYGALGASTTAAIFTTGGATATTNLSEANLTDTSQFRFWTTYEASA
jgi:hypothetical protein